ncbi:trihelix transcription factor ASIL2-like [Oryza glaberrima]|uniref:Myb/SANT-like DNA-binding domain-containing protein n=1 Tax=Oryza glaberrima TaxID=4538 RepID=I1QJL1_ORYGL|nr:trihelix transcription factor ASIL2-like [Oryza glaberrima]
MAQEAASAAAAGEEGALPQRRRKSAPGQPWAHMETMHLLDAYEERWTRLRRGQLKAQQWEEVAADVAARCAASGAALRKTGTQCRHKLEKLRKRYRIEGARPVTSLWPYFRRMERLERGPLPVSSAFPPPPPAASPPAAASDEDDDDDDDDEEDDEEEEEVEEPIPRNNTRSINGILRDSGGGGGGFSGFAPRPPPQQPPPSFAMLSTAPPRKRVPYEAFQAKVAMADKVKEEEPPPVATRPGGGTNEQLSAVVRDFGQGIMRLERRRMEMQWEIDRGWKETEARHNRMLLDAQRHLHEALAATPPPLKKARREHGGDGS